MKRWIPLGLAASILLCAMCAQAQSATGTGRRATPTDTRFETLRPDSALSDARRFDLENGARPGDIGTPYSRIAPGDPLGMNAPEATGGYWHPLSQSLSSLIETSVATGALGMSEWSVLGQLSQRFGSGWGMQAGVRHSELGMAPGDTGNPAIGGLGLTAVPVGGRSATLGADLGMVTLERFWDRYRGAYTMASGRAEGGSTATSHRLQLDYFYSDQSSFGLSYTTGRSFDSRFGLNTLTPVDSNNVGVIGEHWFGRSWAINYNALLEDRIDGLKPELRLGLRLRF
jgi:hypothetical protein